MSIDHDIEPPQNSPAAPPVSAASVHDAQAWQRLTDQSVQVLAITDMEGRFRWLSPACGPILGFSAAELTGRRLSELVHADDRAGTLTELARVTAGPAVVCFENRCRGKDGAYRWLAWSAVLNAGRQQIHAMATDITERKRAEHAWQESERRLRGLLQGSPIPTFVIDERHRVIHWNKALEELSGIKFADVVGTAQQWRAFYRSERPCMADLLVDGHEEAVAAWYAGKFSKSTLIPEAYEATDFFGDLGKHGRWLRFTAAVIRDSTGRLAGALETLEDVTARREAEDALRDSETQYRSLFDGVPVGLFRSTPAGRIVDANPALLEILGYPDRDTFLAVSALELWCRVGAREQWQALMAQEGVARGVEAQMRRYDGRVIDVRLNTRATRDSNDDLLWYEGSVEEITEQKRAAREKAELEGQLRQAQKLEAIGQLAGGVAHDFNNILTAILGNVDVACSALEHHGPVPAPVTTALEHIEHSAQRAANLTRQLLAFSRRHPCQPQIVDVNRVTTGLEPMLRRLLAENIALTITTDPALKAVCIDPGQLEQVILNLAVNARDAMPDGGRLTLETTNEHLSPEDVSATPEVRPGPYVMLRVSDTGCGMDAATMERIFDPFFTTKPVGHGTGLGLATVYGILKQAGGHIQVASEPGRGTTFRVYLLASSERAPDPHAGITDEQALTGTETILVCEDDDGVRELAVSSLKEAGYRVLPAAAGAEAQRVVAQRCGPIDLLLTDVILPDTNGRELSRLLTARAPNLRTLYVSGYTANVLAHHGVLQPDVQLLEKPFTRTGLLSRIREVLNKERSHTGTVAP